MEAGLDQGRVFKIEVALAVEKRKASLVRADRDLAVKKRGGPG
jgi:hypothetical protein